MAFTFLTIGLALIISGVRGTERNLYTLLKSDFIGQDNFLFWFASILIIGALGYIEDLRGLSRMFLVLVLIVLFLKTGSKNGTGGGFFAQFNSALQSTEKQTSTATSTGNASSNLVSV